MDRGGARRLPGSAQAARAGVEEDRGAHRHQERGADPFARAEVLLEAAT